MFIDAALILKTSATSKPKLRRQVKPEYWLGWRANRQNMAYHGLMKDLQIFNKVLSETELQSIRGQYIFIYHFLIEKIPLSFTYRGNTISFLNFSVDMFSWDSFKGPFNLNT